MPVAMIAAAWTGSSCQLSLVMVAMPAPCSDITGSASALATPTWLRDGPMARRSKCFGALPVMMKPPMATLAPVSTFIRVDGCWSWAGVAVGVVECVAVGAMVAVAVGVGDGVIPWDSVGD